MRRGKGVVLAVLVLGLLPLVGCQDLVIDKEKLFQPGEVSEIVGFLAGFGTTFAAVPDLLAMLRRRSSAGMNPPHGRQTGKRRSAEMIVEVINPMSSRIVVANG